MAPLADAPSAARVAVPARKNRSISPMVSSCIRPAIEFSSTMMNSAPRMPATTSWHNSNDPKGNAGSCVTRVGTRTARKQLGDVNPCVGRIERGKT